MASLRRLRALRQSHPIQLTLHVNVYIRLHERREVQCANSQLNDCITQVVTSPKLDMALRTLGIPIDKAGFNFSAQERRLRRRQYLDVVEFDVQTQVEGATRLFLAVHTVAGIAVERGCKEPVADGIADAAAT